MVQGEHDTYCISQQETSICANLNLGTSENSGALQITLLFLNISMNSGFPNSLLGNILKVQTPLRAHKVRLYFLDKIPEHLQKHKRSRHNTLSVKKLFLHKNIVCASVTFR